MRIKRGVEPWNGSVQWMPTVFYALPVPAIRGPGGGGADIKARLCRQRGQLRTQTSRQSAVFSVSSHVRMDASTQFCWRRISRVCRDVNEVVVVKGLDVLEEDILTLRGEMSSWLPSSNKPDYGTI